MKQVAKIVASVFVSAIVVKLAIDRVEIRAISYVPDDSPLRGVVLSTDLATPTASDHLNVVAQVKLKSGETVRALIFPGCTAPIGEQVSLYRIETESPQEAIYILGGASPR
ncbi:MAG: hypothetical protein KDG50_05440 [Chromatiales bacterium]|nr:hypothetical protein [Chromatiales bacterium]